MKPKVDIEGLVRENIRKMTPYSSARNEFTGEGRIFLDANESPVPLLQELHRYPDPLQSKAKKALLATETFGLRGSATQGSNSSIGVENIFLGNGSDEAIDLIYRVFCTPREDRVIIMPPTYGVYKVFAQLNDIAVDEVLLRDDFSIDIEGLRQQLSGTATEQPPKVLWICSPNNPTGTLVPREDILSILNFFPGIVVVDEAYIDFAQSPGVLDLIGEYPNLVLLRTLSKAWGMAGARIGMAFAHSTTIEYINRVKYPYNMGEQTQRLLIETLSQEQEVQSRITKIQQEREWLAAEIAALDCVVQVIPSSANFILFRIPKAREVYTYLLERGIVVRYRGNEPGCRDTLRVTVGTAGENREVVQRLKEYAASLEGTASRGTTASSAPAGSMEQKCTTSAQAEDKSV